MSFRALGQKLNRFRNSVGQKFSQGFNTLGRKLYDNRYNILGAVATAGLAGGVYSQRENIDKVRTIRNTYSNLDNIYEKEGYREQMRDFGVPNVAFTGL